MTRRTHAARDPERGSATLELAILTPAVLLFLGLVVLTGRIQVAAAAVEHAAHAAARDASLARTPDAARSLALDAAQRELAAQDIRCSPSSVLLDASGFAADVGQTGTVTVTVSCTVGFADLAIPGLPGARTLTATATSTLDRYRTR